MKKFLGLVVILAAIVLGGYYGMGIITERTLKKNVVLINRSNGLHVDVQEYHRGWFTSNAKFHWRLHIPERIVKNQDGQSSTVPAQDYNLDMPLKVYHGPIIFADNSVRFGLGYAHTDLNLPQEFTQQFADLFSADSVKPEMKVSVLVNYLNRSRLRIQIPAFKLIAKDGTGNFEWLGLTNDVTVSSNLGTVKGDLIIEGVNLSKDTTKATLGKVTSDYDLHQTKEGLYLGEANLSFPSLIVTDKDQKVFQVEKFDVHSSSDIDGGLFNSYFKTSLDKVIAGSKVYGPGLLKMSIKNLDAQVLAKINQQANQLQQGLEADRQQALMALLPELPKLFSKGAEFEVSELSFVMPEGRLEGNILVSLPKGDITNPFQLIQKIQGQGQVKIPAVILQGIMQQSIKQQLTQPNLQQAMTQQMQAASQSPDATATGTTAEPAQANAVPGATTTTPATGTDNSSAATPAPVDTAADIDQKAKSQADQKLANLVQSGILVRKGDDYVVEFKLADGQLTVNGQPFNPATMKL